MIRRLLPLLLVCILRCHGQTVSLPGPGPIHVSGGIVVTGGFTFLQGTSASVTGNSGSFQIQDGCGASVGTVCTLHTLPTTAGSDMVIGIVSGNQSTITILSAFSCVSSNPCLSTSADLVDTFSLIPSSGGHVSNSARPDNIDVVFVAGGGGGATIITMNISATPTDNVNNYEFEEFGEILPPLCGGTVCGSSFDANVTQAQASGSCATSCTGGTLSVTETDGVIGIIDTNNTITNLNSNYYTDYVGNQFANNLTSTSGNQFKTAGWLTLSTVAFKTTGLAYTPPTATWTFVGNSPPPGNQITFTAATCSPTCTITLPVSSGIGKLGVLMSQGFGANGTISSVTDSASETWAVPTGANTCLQTGGPLAMSCAYILSTSASITTITVTMTNNGTYNFAYFIVSRSSGSAALDVQNSSSASSILTSVPGQALTFTGPDACFQEITWAGSAFEIAISKYFSPSGANFFPQSVDNGGVAALLNVSNNVVPTYLMNQSITSRAVAGICFK